MTADLRYPVGPFKPQASITLNERNALIQDLGGVSAELQDAVTGLDDAQLDTAYRDGGWTLRQVVHHVADAHMGGYSRFKLAMTEHMPTIQLYDQDAWSQMADATATPIAVSLTLVDNLHKRWVTVLQSIGGEAFGRLLIHPKHGTVNVDWLLQIYAWHGRHHVAHITSLRQRKGW
jgi:uncharacterized damage-inducible protein DinB